MSTLKVCIEGVAAEVKELLAKLAYRDTVTPLKECCGNCGKESTEQEPMPPYPDTISGNLADVLSFGEDTTKEEEKDREWYKERLRNSGVDFSERARLVTLQDLWESWLENHPEGANEEESVEPEVPAQEQQEYEEEKLAPEETEQQEVFPVEVFERTEPETEVEEKEVSIEYMRDECKSYGARMKSFGHENPTNLIKKVIRIFGKADDSYKVEPSNRQAVIDACQSDWSPVNESEGA